MKSKSVLLTLPMTVLVTGAAIVACGPQKNYVPVQVVPRAPLLQALVDCREQLPKTKDVRLPSGGRVVPVCEVPQSIDPSPSNPSEEEDEKGEKGKEEKSKEESLEARSGAPSEEARLPEEASSIERVTEAAATTGGASDQNGAKAYQFVNKEVSYKVSRVDDRLVVSLKIGVDLPASIKKKEKRAEIRSLISKYCVPKLGKVFRRSVTGIDLALSVDVVEPTRAAMKSMDQLIRLERVAGKDEAYQLANWPDRGALHREMRPEDAAKCNALPPSQFDDCQAKAMEATNQYFCASFSVLAGHWLGLQAPAELQVRCADKMAPGAAEDLAFGVMTLTGAAGSSEPSTFMKASVQNRGLEFFEKARFSTRDLKTILGPACKSMQTVPDDSGPDHLARR